jgi:hypothetical protein
MLFLVISVVRLKYVLFTSGPAYSCLQERYNVKRVIEFYGATEGNVNMYNSTGRCHGLCSKWTLLTGMSVYDVIYRQGRGPGLHARHTDGALLSRQVSAPSLNLNQCGYCVATLTSTSTSRCIC